MRAERNAKLFGDLCGFAEPRAWRHGGGGSHNALGEGTRDSLVDRVTHPEVVASYHKSYLTRRVHISSLRQPSSQLWHLVTDARRESEAGQVGGEEGRDLSDLSFAQREDIKAARNVGRSVIGRHVGAERDLAVGRGRQEPPPRLQRFADQECPDLVL